MAGDSTRISAFIKTGLNPVTNGLNFSQIFPGKNDSEKILRVEQMLSSTPSGRQWNILIAVRHNVMIELHVSMSSVSPVFYTEVTVRVVSSIVNRGGLAWRLVLFWECGLWLFPVWCGGITYSNVSK